MGAFVLNFLCQFLVVGQCFGAILTEERLRAVAGEREAAAPVDSVAEFVHELRVGVAG